MWKAISLQIVADPLSNQYVVTKNYVDKNAITTDGDVAYGDIKWSVGSYLVRSLGCNDLTTGKKFTLSLGSDTNMLSYSLPDSGLAVPVKIKTDGGFAVLINQLPICDFCQDRISCSQPLDMDNHLIKIVKNPVNKFDAINKAYVDRIKYNMATGIILNTVWTDYTLFTFPGCESFCKWQDNNMWDVGWTISRWVNCNINSNVRNCVAWLSKVFPRSIPYDILHWFTRQWLDSQFSPWLCRTTVSQFI